MRQMSERFYATAAVVVMIIGVIGVVVYRERDHARVKQNLAECVAYLHEQKLAGYYCKPDIRCDAAYHCPVVGYEVMKLEYKPDEPLLTTKASCLMLVTRKGPFHRGFRLDHAACDSIWRFTSVPITAPLPTADASSAIGRRKPCATIPTAPVARSKS